MKIGKVFINTLMIMMWAVVMYATYTALREHNDMETSAMMMLVLYTLSFFISAALTPLSYDKTIIKEHTKEVVTDPEKMKATIHLCVHHQKDDKCEVKVLHETESIEDPSMLMNEVELDFVDFLNSSSAKHPRIKFESETL